MAERLKTDACPLKIIKDINDYFTAMLKSSPT
jgi:hypothetical protein